MAMAEGMVQIRLPSTVTSLKHASNIPQHANVALQQMRTVAIRDENLPAKKCCMCTKAGFTSIDSAPAGMVRCGRLENVQTNYFSRTSETTCQLCDRQIFHPVY
jgi:hypothetical protein